MDIEGSRTSLRELALLFLRLGATAFGGPAAHIAMIHDEVVVRRKWLSEERFLDLLGAANLIPGPTSTELAIHVGWERRRGAGLVVAGVCFIVPAMLITAACGWAYVEYAALPQVGWILYGVAPVVLGIVVQAIAGLAPKAARTRVLRLLAALAVALVAIGVHELAVLFVIGVLATLSQRDASPSARTDAPPAAPMWWWPFGGAVAAGASGITLPAIFWVFCKIGSVLFGSGYVLLAFLRADLVEDLGWLTEAQLVDAVAVGQVTPGPVFTTATFIGYVLAGHAGALVATAGIFLPAFTFVAMSGPLVPRIRSSRVASAFLDGVNVASLALMVVVTAQLARATIVDVPTLAIGLLSAVVLVKWKPSSTWLVLGGAALGWSMHALGLAS
ncbi:chromate efflux transporter [Sandaracinus amylolyticus]|uniref:Chromate transport protein ChrA n=1 Tax=Sandaracinus amylolyticus TaxID=927083 RepID=A0A0F6W0B0_9BACT|nr:chromate efflux transporter [Sandaracinus amylolyticus]AKF04193.1 Chromate transport protein ChrA [Sandaracinus amylolyticus]